jgi:hypothetical protein
MSQNPNEPGYFTTLLNSNQRYGGSSNTSTPSSQNSPQPSSPYGSQPFNPMDVYTNQQIALQQAGFAAHPQRVLPPQFFNPSQASSFPAHQSQPQVETQPQVEPQFKVPKARSPAKSRGKKTKAVKGKKVVNLDADDDDDLELAGQTRVNRKWCKAEEKLLAEIWIAISQDKDLGNDKSEEYFWNEITEMFNQQTVDDPRGKNMLTGKWTRMNGDCQKFNAIYKHLVRRSGENEHDQINNAKVSFAERFGARGFTYEHVWEFLRNYPKWNVEDPLDVSCLEDIFGPDARPRPERANKRAGKKQ